MCGVLSVRGTTVAHSSKLAATHLHHRVGVGVGEGVVGLAVSDGVWGEGECVGYNSGGLADEQGAFPESGCNGCQTVEG